MDFSEPENWTRIRCQAEAFVAETLTQEMITEELETGDGVNRQLSLALGKRGWVAATWPVEEGGAGLDGFEASVVATTIRLAGGTTIATGTTMLVANAMRALASPDLNKEVLPGVAAGEILICLGYTEPEGGSDVFACKTKAVADGAEWVINGQKMFTTFAHRADYCFLLTRTDPASSGPKGLTLFLVPMETPGIERQPVWTMGYERTNVVFYNDVRISDFYRVGEAGGGLAVMRAALEAEQNLAPASKTTLLYDAAVAWARHALDEHSGRVIEDPQVRVQLARFAIENEITDLLGHRVSFINQIGGKPGPHAALYGSESYLRWAAKMQDIAGAAGLISYADAEAAAEGAFEYHFRTAVAGTIYGGSSEVLRSLIAEQRLGLPRSRPKS